MSLNERGTWNWNTAFPPSESNEASEPISGSPVDIEEVFVRIDSPRVVINQEEPFTLKALELSGEINKDFDAQLSLTSEEALIHQDQESYPLQFSLSSKILPDNVQSSIQISSDLNIDTDIALFNYLEDIEFDIKVHIVDSSQCSAKIHRAA